MAVRKGRFGQVRKLAQEAKERVKDYGDWVRKLILKDGETAVVWFSGSAENEPYIGSKHYHPSYGYAYCMVDDCPVCTAAENGDKNYRRGQAFTGFNVVDTRLFHKVPIEGEKDKNKYVECAGDSSCKRCRRKEKQIRGGRCVAEYSLTWGEAIGAQEEKIRKKCANCYEGKIKVTGYQCPKCRDELDWAPDDDAAADEEKIKCGACKATVRPVEVTECTKCDKAKRATIFGFGCPIEITRSGDDRNTSYNFTPIWPPPEPEDWCLEDDMEPFDLEEKLKPPTAQELATKFHVPVDGKDKEDFENYDKRTNPFKSKKQKQDDDDEERPSFRERFKKRKKNEDDEVAD